MGVYVTELVQPDRGDDLVSFHTLAMELDTDIGTVLSFARELHIPARDTSFRLTPEQAETVRDYYRLSDGTLARDKPAEVLPGFNPGKIVREHDPQMATLERIFQVPEHRRHDFRRRPTRPSSSLRPGPLSQMPATPPAPPRRPTPPAPVLTGLAAEVARVLPNLPATAANSVARVWSEQYGVSDEHTIEWLQNGLQPGEARVAVELAGYGVEPYHLSLIIRRETVIARLREGRLTPYRIAELLRREGFIAAA